MWKPVENHIYNHAILGIRTHKGIPVLIQRAGCFPVIQNEAGQTTSEMAHVAILVGCPQCAEDDHYSSVVVEARGPKHGKDPRTVYRVWSTTLPASRDPKALIEEALTKLDLAVISVVKADKFVEDQQAAIRKGYQFSQAFMLRSDYEAACDILLTRLLSDADCASMSVRFGRYMYPEAKVYDILTMRLARLRYYGMVMQDTIGFDDSTQALAPKLGNIGIPGYSPK